MADNYDIQSILNSYDPSVFSANPSAAAMMAGMRAGALQPATDYSNQAAQLQQIVNQSQAQQAQTNMNTPGYFSTMAQGQMGQAQQNITAGAVDQQTQGAQVQTKLKQLYKDADAATLQDHITQAQDLATNLDSISTALDSTPAVARPQVLRSMLAQKGIDTSNPQIQNIINSTDANPTTGYKAPIAKLKALSVYSIPTLSQMAVDKNKADVEGAWKNQEATTTGQFQVQAATARTAQQKRIEQAVANKYLQYLNMSAADRNTPNGQQLRQDVMEGFNNLKSMQGTTMADVMQTLAGGGANNPQNAPQQPKPSFQLGGGMPNQPPAATNTIMYNNSGQPVGQ